MTVLEQGQVWAISRKDILEFVQEDTPAAEAILSGWQQYIDEKAAFVSADMEACATISINPRRCQLYGLDAISASNGWAISVVGISIVFTGLVSLSAVISQLHKLVDLFEIPERLKAFSYQNRRLGPETTVLTPILYRF